MILSTNANTLISLTFILVHLINVGSVAARRLDILRKDISSSIRKTYSKQKQDGKMNPNIPNFFEGHYERFLEADESYESMWGPSASISMSLSMSMAMPTDIISDFPSLTPSFAPSIDNEADHLLRDIPSYVKGTTSSTSPSSTNEIELQNEILSPTSQLIPRVEGESPEANDESSSRRISTIGTTVVVLVAALALVIGFLSMHRRMRANHMTDNGDGISSNES